MKISGWTGGNNGGLPFPRYPQRGAINNTTFLTPAFDFAQSVLGTALQLFYSNADVANSVAGGLLLVSPFVLGKTTSITRSVSTGAENAAKEGFSSMMEAGEAARYAKYWENYAPKGIKGEVGYPGQKIQWTRISGRTGQTEISTVIYDNAGRQVYRIDYSNHMRALEHSNPHLHFYEYNIQFLHGKETLFNLW